MLPLLFLLAAQEPPVLKVTTRLVQVNVVVKDKKGDPVSDLTRDDFIVLDHGKEQPIRLFAVESTASARKAAALPPGVYANRVERRAGLPTSLTVVLLDFLNTRVQDQVYARQQAIKFLQQLQPTDRVGIYTLGTSLRVVHDFTGDTAALLRALASLQGQHSGHLDASVVEEPDLPDDSPEMRQLAEALREMNQQMANFYITRRVETTLAAIEAIANRLAGLPGRKNLVWVSGGFPLFIGLEPGGTIRDEVRSFAKETDRAMRAVNDANLAIYPVDARGLISMADYYPSFSAATRPGRGRAGIPIGDQRTAAAILRTHDTMRELADRTGGRAFINTNDITGAIRAALDDSALTYVLAYVPSHNEWNGKFRELKVRVKRPGVEVRHRKGYVAAKDGPESPKERETVLARAATSPLEANGLGLRVEVAPVSRKPEDPLRFRMVLDPQDVFFANEKGRRTAELDILLAMRNAEGRVLKTTGRVARISMTPETLARATEGVWMDGALGPTPGTTVVRVVVRDSATGVMGSVDVPLI